MVFKCRCLLRPNGSVRQCSPWIKQNKTNRCRTLVGIGFTIIVPIFVAVIVFILGARPESKWYRKILGGLSENLAKVTGGKGSPTTKRVLDKMSRRRGRAIDVESCQGASVPGGTQATVDTLNGKQIE